MSTKYRYRTLCVGFFFLFRVPYGTKYRTTYVRTYLPVPARNTRYCTYRVKNDYGTVPGTSIIFITAYSTYFFLYFVVCNPGSTVLTIIITYSYPVGSTVLLVKVLLQIVPTFLGMITAAVTGSRCPWLPTNTTGFFWQEVSLSYPRV